MLYKQLQFTTGWFGKLMFKFDSKIDIRFDDVIGYDAQKIKLRQAISKILNNQESKPKGIIIKGPEGTGKTFMAKAFIGEAQMPYMIISGGEVKSATDIKRIFSVARLKKSCIIFFDEFDAIDKNDNGEKICAQFNFEMSKKDNILVVATTRKENIERSVKRLGRFDIKIEMYFPDAKERKEILEYWCQKNEISTSEDSFMIAKKCFGKSFLKIIHIMDVAKDIMQKHNHNEITSHDFIMAIMMEEKGDVRKFPNLPEEIRVTAFHEAGHALFAFYLEKERVREIAIIPFNDSRGHITTYPISQSIKWTKEYLEFRIMLSLAGKASEEIFFGTSSDGAKEDLINAERLLRKYLVEYCFDDELGIVPISSINVSLLAGTDVNNQVLNRIKELLNKFYEETKKIITEHKDMVTEMAEKLLEQKILDEKEAYEIYDKYQSK